MTRLLSRVVWAEGMHLSQHHFQAQGRYFEDSAAFALEALFFRPWGVAGCELDDEALLNGTAAVVHARGVMPDGLPFQFPDDPSPEPLDVRDAFSPTDHRRLLLLGIPPYRPGQPNCESGNGGPPDVRFSPQPRKVPDETSGEDEQPVVLARKNYRLLLEGDAPEDLVTLPLARVMRDGTGHFVYDREYVPPCLRIGASPRLVELLRRLVEILDARAGTAARARLDPGGGPSPGEVVSVWLSHAIHSSLGPLRHLLETRGAHPEALYAEMARLGGALCTFSLDAHPRDLPLYRHDDLEACFAELDRHIRRLLDVVVPTGWIDIPLEAGEPSFWAGAVHDRRCFGRARWYLGVRSSLPEAEVAARVPRLVKVCSAKHIARLVREAYPGLRVDHVSSPPAALGPRVGTQYFALDRTDPCWSSIVDTGEVGVYVPGAITDAEVELRVVPEE